jgi:ADP-ribose pyrophosphatase YjhB (NUDIX family)
MPKQEEIKHYRNPFPTTDILIEYMSAGKPGLVLIERKNVPYGIALPGGFAEWGISLEDNAIKEAKEETGLDIILENPEHPLCVKSSPSRDPRGHMISIAYIAKGYGDIVAGDDARKAGYYSLEDVCKLIDHDKLVFDHSEIVQEYMREKYNLKDNILRYAKGFAVADLETYKKIATQTFQGDFR